ncbi:hypothetical protein X551_02751 [Methylibium sp. T29]|nr:hypothetical protein X551_02751 [Methylibium sp. T29]EWS59409.1 hypothetical protein Y694_02787 [Methylibium sp. T29-B]
MRRQRHAAAAAQCTRDRALRMHRQPARLVRQRPQGGPQRRMALGRIGPQLDAERPLARGGDHRVGLEHAADALGQTQALQADSSQHDGVVLAFVELAQAGVEVAAQRLDAQVGPAGAQLAQPPQARGADHRAGRQRGQVGVAWGDPGVTRVLALQHRGEHETDGQVHRHILQRMHREVGVTGLQRGLELLDEQALATDLAERAVQDLVAARRHPQQLDRRIQARAEQCAHMLGLPQRQPALAGRDDPGLCARFHAGMLAAPRAAPKPLA